MFLSADIPSWSVEIEEKASGYSARSKVLFDTWDSGGGWYQPSIFMPLSNILVYLSFSIFGVGLTQLRIPFAFVSVLSLVIFYLIFKEELNRKYALLGVLIISFVYPLFLVNRSALNENLFVFLIALLIFLYQRSMRSEKIAYYMLTGFVAFLNGLVKIYGFVFVLTPIISIFFPSAPIKKKIKFIIFYFLGASLGAIFGITLIFSTNSPRELFDFYFYFNKYDHSIQVSYIYKFSAYFFNLLGIGNSIFLPTIGHILIQFFLNTPRVIFSLMPFLFLLIFYGFFLQLNNRKHLFHFDYFNLLLILSGLIAVQGRAAMYYKNIIFLVPLICYIFIKALYMVDDGAKGKIKLNIKKNRWLYTIMFIYILILLIVSLDVHTGNSLIKTKNAYEENWSILEYLSKSKQFLLYISVIVAALSVIVLLVNNMFHKILKREDNLGLIKNLSVVILILHFLHSGAYLLRDYSFSNVSYNSAITSAQVEKLVPGQATIAVLNEDVYRILGYRLKNKFIFVSDHAYESNEIAFDIFNPEKASFFAFLDKKINDFDPNNYFQEKCGFSGLYNEYRYFHDGKGEMVIKIVDLKNCAIRKEKGSDSRVWMSSPATI